MGIHHIDPPWSEWKKNSASPSRQESMSLSPSKKEQTWRETQRMFMERRARPGRFLVMVTRLGAFSRINRQKTTRSISRHRHAFTRRFFLFFVVVVAKDDGVKGSLKQWMTHAEAEWSETGHWAARVDLKRAAIIHPWSRSEWEVTQGLYSKLF